MVDASEGEERQSGRQDPHRRRFRELERLAAFFLAFFFGLGIFAPALRAVFSAIAVACLRDFPADISVWMFCPIAFFDFDFLSGIPGAYYRVSAGAKPLCVRRSACASMSFTIRTMTRSGSACRNS